MNVGDVGVERQRRRRRVLVPHVRDDRVAQSLERFIEKLRLEEFHVLRPANGVTRLDRQHAKVFALVRRNHFQDIFGIA